MKKLFLFISLLLVGCATTKQTGTVEDKIENILPEICYVDGKQCVPEQRAYYLVVNGKTIPVYKAEWNRYEIGDKYP